MSLSRKQVPAYLMLIVVAFAGIAGAMVVIASGTIGARSVTTINGEVFTLTGDLSVSGFSTAISTQAASAVGTSGSPVAMTSVGSAANDAITLGHYVYSVNVTVASIHNSQEYKVTLLQSGTSVDDVYIKQGPSAAQNDNVTVTWDIGTSLTSHVYEIDIVPAS
ncbi:MAG: hypothetical protein ABSB10_05210 [Candidatus Bathyarchaeia archaeon]